MMKKIAALICTALLSVSAFASSYNNGVGNGTGNSPQSTARGPLVECNLPDGSSDYLPSEICREKGGKRAY